MTSRVKVIKATFVAGWAIGIVFWVTASSFSQSPTSTRPKESPERQQAATTKNHRPEDFVGSETCKGCHEDQFKNFSKTAHAKLESEPSWKNRIHGCEACHGAGRQHVEAGGDKSLIRTFENETSKQISETCVTCHAGREEHSNFLRGEHWRNNVGCTDCHTAHSPDPAPPTPASHTLVGANPRRKIDTSVLRLLKASEPQLCLNCHTEQRAQFSMPFRHKVLEGVMKCSDCHNPHGGFETRQLRLATGTDSACAKCHTDKQGPFVFEHSPVRVEGCAVCHQPHGSANPKLLTRSHVFQLCIECHTNAHQLVLREEGEGAPAPPSFHDLRQERIRNCTLCHTQIHGSNNHNFFFR